MVPKKAKPKRPNQNLPADFMVLVSSPTELALSLALKSATFLTSAA
jgi:hypothetical protein